MRLRLPRVAALPLAVRATVVLLLGGALLVVLGTFNGYLGWDLFSPRTEKVLWAVFASCVALGGFGFAITLVLGVQEVVVALRRGAGPAVPAAGRAVASLFWIGGVLATLAVVVAGLDRWNAAITHDRTAVYKALAQREAAAIEVPLRAALANAAPCAGCANADVDAVLGALRAARSFSGVTLYLPVAGDDGFLWRYGRPTWQATDPGFERVPVTTDLERAIGLALRGDGAWIAQKNAGADFTWNAVFDGIGAGRALLRLEGNPAESFRDAPAR